MKLEIGAPANAPRIIGAGGGGAAIVVCWSAICNFPRREDELMTELVNHKRSAS
jgi:hypothetical protein